MKNIHVFLVDFVMQFYYFKELLYRVAKVMLFCDISKR
jgi:hypothetical protein